LRNLVGAEWDYRRRAIAPTSLPYLLRVDPTTACTAACPYCWRTNSPALPPAVLSVETLREAFGPLREVCLLASFQMFGEPTLNPALPEMVEHVHREGAATYVSTSLLVDDPDRLTRLLGSGLDLLTISLDAATPETYRRVKPGADLEVARRNTERLFEARARSDARPRSGSRSWSTGTTSRSCRRSATWLAGWARTTSTPSRRCSSPTTRGSLDRRVTGSSA
jgi:hypothetical protein